MNIGAMGVVALVNKATGGKFIILLIIHEGFIQHSCRKINIEAGLCPAYRANQFQTVPWLGWLHLPSFGLYFECWLTVLLGRDTTSSVAPLRRERFINWAFGSTWSFALALQPCLQDSSQQGSLSTLPTPAPPRTVCLSSCCLPPQVSLNSLWDLLNLWVTALVIFILMRRDTMTKATSKGQHLIGDCLHSQKVSLLPGWWGAWL